MTGGDLWARVTAWVGAQRTLRLVRRPSPAAARRAAGALILLVVAGALASARSPGLVEWGAFCTAAGVVLMAAGFAIRQPKVISAGVVAAGVAVATGLIRRGGVDVVGAVEGTALLVAAELAWWSLEGWIGVPAEPGTDRPRWLTLSALALAGLGLGSATTALTAGGALARPRFGAAGLESIGAAGAVVVVALVLAIASRGDRSR